VLVGLDHLRVEAVTEEVSDAAVQLVEPLRVDAVEPVVHARDRLNRAFDHSMRVVGHEAERMHLEPFCAHQAPEERQHEPVVLAADEDRAPVDAAHRDVEDPVCRKHPSRNPSHPRILL
jgi:hypothetical protein